MEQNEYIGGTITTGAAMAKSFKVYAGPGKIEVQTDAGFGVIYIDKERQEKAAIPGSDWTFAVEPGPHRVSVEMGGQFAYDQDVIVPADGNYVLVGIVGSEEDAAEEAKPEEPAPEQPAGEPVPAAEEPNPLMDFADAIRAVKAGKRICRVGWNGKHQFIELASCISYKNAAGEIINAEHEAIGSQALAFVGTSGIQIGWLASQADMLANDWQIAVISEYAVMPQRGA